MPATNIQSEVVTRFEPLYILTFRRNIGNQLKKKTRSEYAEKEENRIKSVSLKLNNVQNGEVQYTSSTFKT